MDPCDYIAQTRVTRTRNKDFKFKAGDLVWWREEWREERRVVSVFERTRNLVQTRVTRRDYRNEESREPIYDIPACPNYWVKEDDLVSADEYAAITLAT